MLTILFDGIAYGMLLFVLACGLSVTLGLMNFVNLAHGAFAMAGGYITLLLVNRAGVPFFAGLPIAFLITALIGAVFERSLYVHVYNKSHLDQVLFTIGLVFMSVAAVDYFMGSQQVFIAIPSALQGRFELFGIGIGRYRLLIIVVCGILTVALQLILSGTRFGNDTLLAHTLGQHTLSHSVVDLMRPGMCQILAFEIDLDPGGDHCGETWHVVECSWASYVTEKFSV